MSMTIELGWWIVPLTLTVVAFGLAFLLMRHEPGVSLAINRVINGFFLALAFIAALAGWLAWALVLK
jgi:hypothetical protein